MSVCVFYVQVYVLTIQVCIDEAQQLIGEAKEIQVHRLSYYSLKLLFLRLGNLP